MMHNGRINTYHDLLEEEKRIREQLKQHRLKVEEDFNVLRIKFYPVERLFNGINRFVMRGSSKQVLPKLMDIGVDLISTKYFFKKAGFIKTFVGSYMLRVVSQLLVGNMMQKKSRPID